MIARCTNPLVAEYHRYGGRGIKVCDRWFSFDNFLADMGDRSPGLSLDRFPNGDGNYEPGNCRWATRKEQTHDLNPRRNLRLTDATAIEALGRMEHGESQRSIAARLGVDQVTISFLHRGLTWKHLDRPWINEGKRLPRARVIRGG